MTREEAIRHVENIKPYVGRNIKDALDVAIKALEQEHCEDAVSRQAVLEHISCWIDNGEYRFTNAEHYLAKRMQNILPVVPQPKIGRWVLAQRDKYIDINCSECGNTRIKDYAYGYSIDELNLDEANDFLSKARINYCEHCGTKMQGVKK